MPDSTLSAPASATSGLQGYDLEGSRKKKKRKTAAEFLGGFNNHGKTRTMKSAPSRAAGIVLMTDEGKALFLRRANTGDHEGEWAFPGGGIEGDETAEEAAIRECLEEVGYRVPESGRRILVDKVANLDIEYSTFFQRVEQFEPTLNAEHDAYRWQDLENPPQPLHPGVRAVLPAVMSAAVDYTAKSHGANTMDNLSLFVPVLKVDATQRMVYGTAVAEVADRANEIFDYATSKEHFEKWSGDIAKTTDGKSLGNVRAMHSAVAAGKLTDISFNDEAKKIDVAAKIVDDDEWEKVVEGVYTGFSIGGKYLKRWSDGDLKRYTAAPSEISLVDLPCVPTATFELIKADGSEMRKFVIKEERATVAEITNDMVVERATELAKAAGDHFLAHIEEARAVLEEEIAKADHSKVEKAEVSETTETVETTDPVEKTVEAEIVTTSDQAVSNVSTDGEWEQVWVSKRLPGKTFAKKADLTNALAELDATEAAAAKVAEVIGTVVVEKKAAEEVTETVVEKTTEDEIELTKAEGESDESFEKRKFDAKQRKQDAKNGDAESDGSYPIENKTDLENAIRAYGRSKNKAKTKRHIIARARSLGLTSMLPADWKAQKIADTDLQKDASLYGMSDLMNMLACVECLEDRAESSSYGFGVDLPKDVTDRFGLALVNLGDVVADVLDVVLSSIREEERDEALNRAAPMADLLKAGARAAAANKETSEVSETNGQVEKAAGSEAIAEENEVLKVKLAATESVFTKALEDIKADVAKRDAERAEQDAARDAEIAKQAKDNDELRKQVMTIRSQPIHASPGPFRVVDKTFDSPLQKSADEPLPDVEDLRKAGLDAQMARIARR